MLFGHAFDAVQFPECIMPLTVAQNVHALHAQAIRQETSTDLQGVCFTVRYRYRYILPLHSIRPPRTRRITIVLGQLKTTSLCKYLVVDRTGGEVLRVVE